MLVEVELRGFDDFLESGIRLVKVPDNELPSEPFALNSDEAMIEALDKVFFYGQNIFQLKNKRSVSVGDVIRLFGQKWKVSMFGFEKIG